MATALPVVLFLYGVISVKVLKTTNLIIIELLILNGK